MAPGRDIHAVGAPLAVEAVHRVLTGRTRTTGVASSGALLDAPDFPNALAPHPTWALGTGHWALLELRTVS